MASQSRKHRGYKSQRIVAEYLAENGFPYAEPVGAGRSGSDVTGVIGIDIEIKARAGFEPAKTMKQLAERGKDGILPLAVMRLNGQGEASIGDWVMLMRFADGVDLLRDAGYGDPKNGSEER